MTALHEYKIWPVCTEDNLYDDLIFFTSPNLISPIFPVEAKMSQVLFEGNAHIVPMPSWSSYIGATRFLVAFITMVLTAAAAGIWGNFTAFGLTLFSCVATLFIGGYHRLALGYKPVLYNRWVVLGLEAFGVIFWLASFVLLAEWTAIFNNSVFWGQTYLAYLPYNITHEAKRASLLSTSPREYHAGVLLAGIATGLGGLEFALFGVTLIVFSINLHKHRKAGYPAIYGAARANPMVSTFQAPGDLEKVKDADEI